MQTPSPVPTTGGYATQEGARSTTWDWYAIYSKVNT